MLTNEPRRPRAATAMLMAALFFITAGCAGSATEIQPGDPRSEAYVALVEAEVDAALTGVEGGEAWRRYHTYIAKLMDDSAGEGTWADKTGNCRLSWVDHLIREPMAGVRESEAFTREVHGAVVNDRLDELVNISARVLDVKEKIETPRRRANNHKQALTIVRTALDEARQAYEEAVASLTDEDRTLLAEQLYPVTTGQLDGGASFAGRKVGRQITDAMEARVNRAALHRAAAALISLTDTHLHERLAQAGAATSISALMPGVSGGIHAVHTSEHGLIVVGDAGPNGYDLDAMTNVRCVIDLGGDDTYREGTISDTRPVLVVLDLGGNDQYVGSKPGIQGGAVMGVSLLYDAAGDDAYVAEDVSQGAALLGVGMLIDASGNDTYKGLRRTQGSAICGLGVLIDRAGDDHYRGALLAQGVGGPLAFGLLDDLAGNDEYYAGGLYPADYDDTPGHSGWSQGMGVGPRGVANGGIGVILDGGGDDVYECDYFSHAGGYWFAAGFARDFGGNDQYVGATRTAYDGSERQPARFTRWGIGFGCHFAVGYLFDDAGDDTYHGETVGIAFAWDFGVTALYDFAGNDRYDIPGSGSANANEAGVALIFDGGGDDVYPSGSHGVGSQRVEYHPTPDCGGNFGFAIDYGGTDQYPADIANDAVTPRGFTREKPEGFGYGFVIDRPQTPTRDAIP